MKDKFFHKNATIHSFSGNLFENGILVFEDIIMFDDRAIQKIVREVDKNELPYALKDASPEVQDKFFHNMSKNVAKMLKEDMSFMGSISIDVIKRSQENILLHIRQLENRGEIVIFRNSGNANTWCHLE